MVSVNPNPSPNPSPGFHFFDPMNNTMALPGLNSPPPNYPALNPSSAAVSGSTSSVEDSSKKIRKPYTITKSRESWTDQEHDKFLEALQLFDRDWKKIEAFVGSKTVIQIRSHAQKYFLKVQKSGASEHVPPPRPKRKASHPYPQKAPKNAAVVSQVGVPVQSTTLLEPGYVYRADPSSVVGAPITSASSWSFNTVPPVSASQTTKDDAVLAGPNVAQNSCYSSSNESSQKTWPAGETDDVKPASGARVMPNFAQVYSFIGSVFDPNASGHLQRLKQMDPIDMETVLLLMKNLAVNLTSPEFEDHKKLLSAYDVGRESAPLGCAYDTLRAVKSESTAQSA